jgi:hypothetical protein
MAGSLHPYLDLVAARAPAPARDWLLSRASRLDSDSFALVYSGAGRRLGLAAIEPSTVEVAALEAAQLLVPRGWPLSAVGRAALLSLVCAKMDRGARLALADNVFRTGDNDERAALLKALSILPEPEGFVDLAIDACRSHVQAVFEAIACENPYPMRFFPEHAFNQMVLKSFFTGVAVKRIEGLAARRSPELARMAEAYASERRAAGRSVPADLHLALGTPADSAPGRS